jgi:hypothetical protein
MASQRLRAYSQPNQLPNGSTLVTPEIDYMTSTTMPNTNYMFVGSGVDPDATIAHPPT